MKKVSLIALILLITFLFSGCGGSQGLDLTETDMVKMYKSLNSRYLEVMDFYNSAQEGGSKFHWRFIADSGKKSSQRVIDYIQESNDADDPTALILIEMAEDIITFTGQLERQVDHNEEADWSYKDKIEANFEKLAPEMEEIEEKYTGE